MSACVPGTEWMATIGRICNYGLLVNLPRKLGRKLTTSSLQRWLRREKSDSNKIKNKKTHIASSRTEDWLTRPAIKYLYAMWGTVRTWVVPILWKRTSRNRQSFMDRIECPIARHQGGCKPKKHESYHITATCEEWYIIMPDVLTSWLTRLFVRKGSSW